MFTITIRIEWLEKWLVLTLARPGGTLATDVGNREAACHMKGSSCPSCHGAGTVKSWQILHKGWTNSKFKLWKSQVDSLWPHDVLHDVATFLIFPLWRTSHQTNDPSDPTSRAVSATSATSATPATATACDSSCVSRSVRASKARCFASMGDGYGEGHELQRLVKSSLHFLSTHL